MGIAVFALTCSVVILWVKCEILKREVAWRHEQHWKRMDDIQGDIHRIDRDVDALHII